MKYKIKTIMIMIYLLKEMYITVIQKKTIIHMMILKIKKEINYNKIINKPEFIEASKNLLNDLQIKLKDDKKKEHLNKDLLSY